MLEPEWSDFKILLALQSGGSVMGAARALGIDHSTVSRRLAALEAAVGACLMVRGGRELSWTVAGRTMLAAAESIKPLVDNALRSARSHMLGGTGAVRLSVPPSFASVLSMLLAAEPTGQAGLAFELRGEYRAADLSKSEADIALRMFRPEEPGLIVRRVMECGWIVCAAPAYLQARGMPESPTDLARHDVVRYVDGMGRVAGPHWLEQHRGNARVSVQVDNTEAAAHTIASGAGIGVVPNFVAVVRAPQLVRVFPAPVAYSTAHIVYHETLRNQPQIRAAVDALRVIFEGNAQLFSGTVAAPKRGRARVDNDARPD